MGTIKVDGRDLRHILVHLYFSDEWKNLYKRLKFTKYVHLKLSPLHELGKAI